MGEFVVSESQVSASQLKQRFGRSLVVVVVRKEVEQSPEYSREGWHERRQYLNARVTEMRSAER
eukprot:9383853-Prorocentrum_lima.AAC.1